MNDQEITIYRVALSVSQAQLELVKIWLTYGDCNPELTNVLNSATNYLEKARNELGRAAKLTVQLDGE